MNRLVFCTLVSLSMLTIASHGYVLKTSAVSQDIRPEKFNETNSTNNDYTTLHRTYNHNTESGITKRSVGASTHVPQFMLDLYEHLQDRRWSPKFDVARSYSVVETRQSKRFQRTANLSDERHVTEMTTIYFNISHFPSDEILQMAQLRLYVAAQKNLSPDDTVRLVVSYHGAPDKNVTLSERILEAQGDYWEAFDVTDIFWEWTKELIQSTQSLEIRVYKPILSDMGVDLRPSSEKEPQILVLSKTSPKRLPSEEHSLPRQKRSSLLEQLNPIDDLEKMSSLRHMIVKRSEDDDEEIEEQSNYIVEELGKPRKSKSKKRKNPCRRRSMKVNFAAIGYDQWIIAPPSYEAFECFGKCSFPMGSHLTPTKHAVIQTLMHSLEPKQVTRACCVPTKLEPISVLYVDKDGTVTYKYEYNDMVVAECGCR